MLITNPLCEQNAALQNECRRYFNVASTPNIFIYWWNHSASTDSVTIFVYFSVIKPIRVDVSDDMSIGLARGTYFTKFWYIAWASSSICSWNMIELHNLSIFLKNYPNIFVYSERGGSNLPELTNKKILQRLRAAQYNYASFTSSVDNVLPTMLPINQPWSVSSNNNTRCEWGIMYIASNFWG